jgi:putative addiction module killer protein
MLDGQTVRVSIIEKSRKKRVYKPYYDAEVAATLESLWKNFNWPCGKLFAPFLRQNLDLIMLREKYPMSDTVTDKFKNQPLHHRPPAGQTKTADENQGYFGHQAQSASYTAPSPSLLGSNTPKNFPPSFKLTWFSMTGLTLPGSSATPFTTTEKAMIRTSVSVYDKWFEKLKDGDAKIHISLCIKRLKKGNPGDVSSIGDGCLEMRIQHVTAHRESVVRVGSEHEFLPATGIQSVFLRQSGRFLTTCPLAAGL